MPELSEVETIRRGLLPNVQNSIIQNIQIRQSILRWPVPSELSQLRPNSKNSKICDVKRRGKYLLFELSSRNILAIHLGMSGNIRLVTPETPLKKHDHIDIILNNNKIIRYNDARRFGYFLWIPSDCKVHEHVRFKDLGPEPLTDDFNNNYLFNQAKTRTCPVKSFIMSNNIVVGVGNIYATEALFYSGINPLEPVNNITLAQYNKLAKQIKKVLINAIEAGGTTLKDFVHTTGTPGYFKQKLAVYGRAGKPCPKCHRMISTVRLQGRATAYCQSCQPFQ